MQNYYFFPTREEHPISSGFGPRGGSFHTGLDFGDMPVGTPVLASADGEVVYVAYEAGGAGNTVTLRHAGNEQTRYHHLSAFLVDRGDVVTVGEPIGLSGNTGASTGPHLHFEIRSDPNTPVDPAPLLQWPDTPAPLPPVVPEEDMAILITSDPNQGSDTILYTSMAWRQVVPGEDQQLVDLGFVASKTPRVVDAATMTRIRTDLPEAKA